MKKILATAFALLLLPMVLSGQTKVWVSGYYAGWMQGYLPPSAIDFKAVTHIMHFSIEPSGAGVSGTGNGIDARDSKRDHYSSARSGNQSPCYLRRCRRRWRVCHCYFNE